MLEAGLREFWPRWELNIALIKWQAAFRSRGHYISAVEFRLVFPGEQLVDCRDAARAWNVSAVGAAWWRNRTSRPFC